MLAVKLILIALIKKKNQEENPTKTEDKQNKEQLHCIPAICCEVQLVILGPEWNLWGESVQGENKVCHSEDVSPNRLIMFVAPTSLLWEQNVCKAHRWDCFSCDRMLACWCEVHTSTSHLSASAPAHIHWHSSWMTALESWSTLKGRSTGTASFKNNFQCTNEVKHLKQNVQNCTVGWQKF